MPCNGLVRKPEPEPLDAAPDERTEVRTMSARKRVALIAHDNRKADMLQWARYNRETLSRN